MIETLKAIQCGAYTGSKEKDNLFVKAGNRTALGIALDSLYDTKIFEEKTAEQRGIAIRAINQICQNLGFDDLVRND